MVFFLLELIHRSWDSSVSSLGTTTLAVFVAIGAGAFVLVLKALRISGSVRNRWDEIIRHWRENIKDGLLAAFVIWATIFGYFLYKVQHEIATQADATAPPPSLKWALPVSPSWANQPLPPKLKVSLRALDEFTFDFPPGPVWNLKARREYSMTVENTGGQSAKSLEVAIQFPFLVEALNIVASRGASGVKFQTSDRMHPFGGSLQVNGCPASSTYTLRAGEMAPRGKVQALLILSNVPPGFPSPIAPHSQSLNSAATKDFMFGRFVYKSEGKAVKGEYYAPLELGDQKVVRVGIPRARSHPIWLRYDELFLPLPCIPSSLLTGR